MQELTTIEKTISDRQKNKNYRNNETCHKITTNHLQKSKKLSANIEPNYTTSTYRLNEKVEKITVKFFSKVIASLEDVGRCI